MSLQAERTETKGDHVAQRLQGLFGARSVALVGATDRSRWSVYTYANLRQFSPAVKVHLVHPNHREVHGQPTVPSLRALDQQVDLAYVMVPTHAALDVVGEAADMGIRNLVILTAGFAEVGPQGVDLERALVQLARDQDLTILGPNGNGFINVAGAVTPYGLPIPPPLDPGPVGIVLQSGGLASIVLAGALNRGIGVSLLVSTGNEALTSATDIIRYLIADEETRVVAAFLESVRQPDEFRAVAALALEAGKPLVVLKVGRSELGARAALAHTGALAGDDRIVTTAFEQLGVIQVDSLEELLATAGYLGNHPGVRGRRIAAITASGGACDLLADRASAEGLELPEFPPETLDELRRVLPDFSNPHNPLDVTGYVVVDASISGKALEVVAQRVAGLYDMVVYSAMVPRVEPPDPTPIESRLDAVARMRDQLPVPLLLQTGLSADLSPYGRQLLSDRDLYIVDGIALGSRAIGHGARYQERRDAWRTRPATAPVPPRPRPADASGVWAEHQVRDLLVEANVPVVPARLARTAEEAARWAAELGRGAGPGGSDGSVVLKAASNALPHKSDAGGVRLDVSPSAAAAAYEALVRDVAAARPDVVLDGVLLTPYRRGGIELLVGVVTDPAWGQVLSVGLGGVWVEVFGDVALRLLPVSPADVAEMLGALKAAPLLRGARGTAPADLDALSDVLSRIARLAESFGDALDTLEVNPLRVDGDQIEVLDALAVWQDATRENGAAR